MPPRKISDYGTVGFTRSHQDRPFIWRLNARLLSAILSCSHQNEQRPIPKTKHFPIEQLTAKRLHVTVYPEKQAAITQSATATAQPQSATIIPQRPAIATVRKPHGDRLLPWGFIDGTTSKFLWVGFEHQRQGHGLTSSHVKEWGFWRKIFRAALSISL